MIPRANYNKQMSSVYHQFLRHRNIMIVQIKPSSNSHHTDKVFLQQVPEKNSDPSPSYYTPGDALPPGEAAARWSPPLLSSPASPGSFAAGLMSRSALTGLLLSPLGAGLLLPLGVGLQALPLAGEGLRLFIGLRLSRGLFFMGLRLSRWLFFMGLRLSRGLLLGLGLRLSRVLLDRLSSFLGETERLHKANRYAVSFSYEIQKPCQGKK